MTQHPKVRPQIVRGRKGANWVGQWREASGAKRFVLLGKRAEMSKTDAQIKLDALVSGANIDRSLKRISGSMTLAAYVEGVFLPHKAVEWKPSTADTTRDRIRLHIAGGELGTVKLRDLSRHNMQAFLDARQHLAKTTLTKLQFDLTGMLDLAVSDGLVERNRARRVLAIPRDAAPKDSRVMTEEQVTAALLALDLRERVFLRIAIYSGMSAGEIAALKWSDIDEKFAVVSRRWYRGKIDTPKTERRKRRAKLPELAIPELAALREFARSKDAWIFESEARTPLHYSNLMVRHIRPALKKVGLEWVDYLVTRRTNATLMHAAGVDPKAAADQRGHGIGVSLDTYTQPTDESKSRAVSKIERIQ